MNTFELQSKSLSLTPSVSNLPFTVLCEKAKRQAEDGLISMHSSMSQFQKRPLDVKQTLAECRPCCEKMADVLMEEQSLQGICR